MPTPFHVGMCNYDGSSANQDWANLSWLDRFNILRQAINWFLPPVLNANDLYCFIAPEFFFGEVAQDKDKWTSLKNALGRVSTAANFLLVGGSMVSGTGSKMPWKNDRYYNRVPIWYGGQFMQYKKKENAGEVGTTEYRHYRAGDTPNTFDMTINGSAFRFGIEVCADHQTGYLDRNANIDVQIITANSTTFRNANIVAGQYALICNPGNVNFPTITNCAVRNCTTNMDVPANGEQSYRVFRWDLQLN